MSDELSDMIEGFVEESHEAFDAIENDLLTIESNPEDLSIINGIFRVMHTIKGTAGFLGLDDINKLSHKLESIFDKVRREDLSITSDLMDNILPAIDLLKLMVFELLKNDRSDYGLSATLETLDRINNGGQEAIGDDESASAEQNEEATNDSSGYLSNDDVDEEDETVIDPEVQKEFVIEAEEHLEVIEENLLKLEKQPDDENSINEVFRAIHSIKGTSDYVNLKKITKLSHKLETIFDKIRKGSREYDNDLADVVLRGVDLLRTLVFMLKMEDTTTVILIDDTLEQLNKYSSVVETPPTPKAAKTKKKPIIKENSQLKAFKNVSSQQMLIIQNLGKHFTSDSIETEDLMVLHRSLKTLENGAHNISADEIVALTLEMDEFVLSVLAGEKESREVSDVFMGQIAKLKQSIGNLINGGLPNSPLKTTAKKVDVAEVTQVIPVQNKKNKSEKDVKKNNPNITSSTNEIKTMRVDSERLDAFMNLIGELIIARNSYNHILGEIADKSLAAATMNGLRAVENAFNRISEDLQTTLMDIRLVAVKSVFQKIPRIVRDISRKRNKKMQLQMIGENTEIDKSIIEIIGDPLVHIVRNCCDHGIETPEERVKAGKPEIGNIILKASHLGSAIAIDIIDDGAGINTERVLEKAVEKGLVSHEKAQKMDAKSINAFIFHAGFSTADKVTDISGRGVGMDVVMTNINKIHGTVEVDSERGQGTQIRLLLPLTLAVVDALIVVEQNQKFAIPLEAVKETVEVKEGDLQHLKQKEAINLRGNVIGVSRLNRLLDLGEKEANPDRVLSIVFIQVGTKVIGIVVDDLCNQQEIVVKPLQGYLNQISGINGSTILGSGEIILILEPTELIDLAAQ